MREAPTTALSTAQGLRITGTVSEAAFVGGSGYGTATPSATLCLKVTPSKGLPYDIRQDLGTNPSAHIAGHAKAKLLTKGAPVVVYGCGLRVRIDHEQALLQVLDVTDVIPGQLPPHHPTQAIDRTQERALATPATPTENAA